jgi:hypothetical protein
VNDSSPLHSGSRWEPANAGDPVATPPSRPAGLLAGAERPGATERTAGAEEDEHRRGKSWIVVAVLAVLTLLVTGGWYAASALRRPADPTTGTTQAPFGDRQAEGGQAQPGEPAQQGGPLIGDGDGDHHRGFDGDRRHRDDDDLPNGDDGQLPGGPLPDGSVPGGSGAPGDDGGGQTS